MTSHMTFALQIRKTEVCSLEFEISHKAFYIQAPYSVTDLKRSHYFSRKVSTGESTQKGLN